AGAFFGFLAAYQTESSVFGMLAGIAAGVLLGLLFGLLTISLRVDQVIVGLAITIFGGGLTAFLYRDVFAGPNPSAEVTPLTITIPGLSDIPIVGPAVFQGQLLFYLAYACVPIFAFLLARTRFGLNVRAVGEDPFAADAAGVDVARIRYAAIAIAGGMAGAAGAFLSVADLKIFQVGMTVGMGFFALALTMVGGWNPWRILIAAVLFGMLRSLGNGLQILGIDIRTEFITMLPYLGVMLALVLLAGRTALPAALGIPYARGRR
ncbi:MAG TPA: ABC transporter permease, partial [Thermomicrobiales bacterium]|nr:ABC transporter permease [Thermomicrobiales bacterium]